MSDTTWVALRAILMIVASFMAGKGYFSEADFSTFLDKLQAAWPGIIALATAGWALWVRTNTVAVPIATGQRKDVPTVSAVTGQTQPATAQKK